MHQLRALSPLDTTNGTVVSASEPQHGASTAHIARLYHRANEGADSNQGKLVCTGWVLLDARTYAAHHA